MACVAYNKDGKQVEFASAEAVAKQEVTESGMKRCYVLVGYHGPFAGQLFNPVGGDSDRVSSLTQLSGMASYKFRQVNPLCFDNYVEFLKTRTSRLFNQARKEM